RHLAHCSACSISRLSCLTSMPIQSRNSVHKRESRCQIHELEHLVDADVDAAQYHPDALGFCHAREVFHPSDCTRTNPSHGSEIQNHFVLDAVQLLKGLLQCLDNAFFIDLQQHDCH